MMATETLAKVERERRCSMKEREWMDWTEGILNGMWRVPEDSVAWRILYNLCCLKKMTKNLQVRGNIHPITWCSKEGVGQCHNYLGNVDIPLMMQVTPEMTTLQDRNPLSTGIATKEERYFHKVPSHPLNYNNEALGPV